MKKLCKNAFAVLLLAAVVLCFAGCGSGTGGNPTDGRIINGVKYIETPSSYSDYSRFEVFSCDSYDMQGCCFWFFINHYNSNDTYEIRWIEYFDSSITEDFFEYGCLDGNDHKYTYFYKYDDRNQIQVADDYPVQFLSRSEVLDRLPSSGSIVTHLKNDTYPERNVTWTIPAENANHIREWIEAQ